MDISEKWGLPPGFAPVRFDVPEEAKNAVRSVLGANEPVIVSLTNDEELVSLVATPGRILSVRTQEIGISAGNSQVKTFPYPGIFNLTLRPQPLIVSFVLEYRTSVNGKTVEIGRRAALGKPKADTLTGFSREQGEAAFNALVALWKWKKEQFQGDA
ncbi:hypothetical protein EON83_06775 [bacterium]|nr:MAG: hypothetical protein EON83_06775 [bacterium]